MKLANKVVVVLGGSSGIGLAAAKAAKDEGAQVIITGRSILQAQAKRLPVGRVGRGEDIAEAALFLMKNCFTTGITLTVDGGHTLV